MKIIATLRESEIYTDRTITPEDQYGAPRRAVRVVLLDKNNNVALGYYPTTENRIGGYNIPGGGIEENEGIQDALIREAREEIGCDIKNIREIGSVIEYGVGKKIKHSQENYCFLAEVNGEKREPEFSEEEIEDGLDIRWMPLDETAGKLKLQKDNFGTRKTLILLEKAIEVMKTIKAKN